jgi:hypothetical protein
MTSRISVSKIGGLLFLLKLTVFLCLLQAQTQDAELNNPNFEFSVYFTGNVRGNLEPCG